MKCSNYLNKLDDSIHVFGLGSILKEINKVHGIELRSEFKGKVHQSLYYYWLSDQSPIKIKHLKMFKKYEKDLFDLIFKMNVFYSAGKNKKVLLPKIITKDLAYLVGAFHGDGHISKNLRNMDLTEENRDYHNIIKRLFKQVFNLETSIVPTKSKTKMIYISWISSKVVCSFFRMYCPVGKKKGLLKVPEQFKEDKGVLAAYLSGFFDTDGCLSKVGSNNKNIYFVFSQSDKEIVFDIYEALKSLEIEVNPPRSFRSQSKPYSGNKDLIQWKIYIGSKKTLTKFLRIVKFRHPSKRKKAEKLIKYLGSWSRS